MKTQAPNTKVPLEENDRNGEEIFKDAANSTISNLWKYRKWFISCGILALLVIALFLSLRSSLSRQKEIEQQLERQNQVIDGLTAKVNEQESIIKDSVPVITSETLKEQLDSVSELVTQQYIYTNADKYESDQTWVFGWKRPFSSKSILVTYDGTIKAGIDLSEVDFNVDEESLTITVTLPESKITDNNIPQDSITVVEVKNGLFNEVTLDDYNQFISEQKIIMEQRAIDRGLLKEASQKAKDVILSTLNLIPGMDKYKIIIN